MNRAVLYARVSSSDVYADGANLEDQIGICRKFSEDHHYEIVAELKEDVRGISGAALYRPQLEVAKEMAEDGLYDVLVVRSLDRLSRDVGDFLATKKFLKRCGVEVQYVAYDFPDTPAGKMMQTQLAAFAEYEKSIILERTMRAKKRIARSGGVITHGKPPFGYQSGENHKLEINEDAAEVVRMIFRWCADEGLSTLKIRDRLIEMGVPTPADNPLYGSPMKRRKYGEWSKGSVHRILTNRIYVGEFVYGEDEIKVEVPAIVDEATYNKVAEVRKANRWKAKHMKNEYLMAGHLKCGKCDAHVKATSTRWKDRIYKYYRCAAATDPSGYINPCNMPRFRVDDVDTAVWEWLKQFLRPKDFEMALYGAESAAEVRRNPIQRELETVESLLESEHAKLERLVKIAINSTQLTAELFVKEQANIEKTIESLERKKEELTDRLSSFGILTESQKDMMRQIVSDLSKDLDDEPSFEKKREIVERFQVKGWMNLEDGQKSIDVECSIGQAQGLLLLSMRSRMYKSARP